MNSTTVQVDLETHARLKEVKEDLTFDQLFRLYLDLVPPEEIRRARAQREEEYRRWQAETAQKVRANRLNKRLF